RLNKEKCSFGLNEIEFLGFRISEEGRRPAESKIEAMRSFPVPMSTKDLERFIGLTGYFRSLIPDYALIAAPLYELLKPKAKFQWNAERQKAFEELKKKMTDDPVVRLPDMEQPFIVKTDACDTGM